MKTVNKDGSADFEEFFKNEKKVILSISRKFFYSVDEAEMAALSTAGEAWCVALETHNPEKSSFKTWFYNVLKNLLRSERLGRDGGDALLFANSMSCNDEGEEIEFAAVEEEEIQGWRVAEADADVEKILDAARTGGTQALAGLLGKSQRRIQQVLKNGIEKAIQIFIEWMHTAERAQILLMAVDLLGDPLPQFKKRARRAPFCRVVRRAQPAGQLAFLF